jgi:hypothetical protein
VIQADGFDSQPSIGRVKSFPCLGMNVSSHRNELLKSA